MIEITLLVWNFDHTAAVMLGIPTLLMGWYYLNCILAARVEAHINTEEGNWPAPRGGDWAGGLCLATLTSTLLLFIGWLGVLLISCIPLWYECTEQLLQHYGLE